MSTDHTPPDASATVRVTGKTPVRTDLATFYSVLAATAILAGGIVSVKRDISDVAETQKEKSEEMRAMRNDLNQIMFHFFIPPTKLSASSTKSSPGASP